MTCFFLVGNGAELWDMCVSFSGVFVRYNTEACYMFIETTEGIPSLFIRSPAAVWTWRCRWNTFPPLESHGSAVGWHSVEGRRLEPWAAEYSFYGDAGRLPVRQRRAGEAEELVEGGEAEQLAEGRRLLVRANFVPAHGQGDEWIGVGSAGSGELRITIRI